MGANRSLHRWLDNFLSLATLTLVPKHAVKDALLIAL